MRIVNKIDVSAQKDANRIKHGKKAEQPRALVNDQMNLESSEISPYSEARDRQEALLIEIIGRIVEKLSRPETRPR